MDPQYADIYYVDTRNATTDHRTGQPASFTGRPVSSVPVIAGGSGVRTVYAQAPQPMYGPNPYGYPAQFPGQAYPGQLPGQYPGAWPQSAAATFLGKLSTGQIVEMVAQLFAALQPLPAAPVATAAAAVDIGNSILYQSALAQHAKRDEQVRTLGSLVARLVG